MIVWLPAPPSTVIVAPSILVSLVKPFLACETVKPLLLKASWAPPDLALMEPSEPLSLMALSPRTTSVAKPTVYVLLPSSAFASSTVMFLPLVTVVFAAVALLLTSFNCSSVAARPDVAKPAYFVVLLVRPLIVAVPPPPLTRTLPILAIEPLIVVWLPIPPSTVISAPLILVSLVTPFLAWETVKPLLLKDNLAPPDLALMEPSEPLS